MIASADGTLNKVLSAGTSNSSFVINPDGSYLLTMDGQNNIFKMALAKPVPEFPAVMIASIAILSVVLVIKSGVWCP